MLLTLVLCAASLVTTVVAAKLMGHDSGTAAGLMAGAFTESTVIGAAGNTIDRLDIPEPEKERMQNNIPVADAVSYLVGTGFWLEGSWASSPEGGGTALEPHRERRRPHHGAGIRLAPVRTADVRTQRAEYEPGHPPRSLRRGGNRHRGAEGHPG
jgi:putative transport protein